jgi:NAD(P)H-hydrate epimerase
VSDLISTAAQCRALDRQLIDAGLPGIALMELASRGVADLVRDRLAAEARRGVAVLCGPGQNGGDGYGAARWLALYGFPVHCVPLADDTSGDAAYERAAARAQGIPERASVGDVGLVVDALFGTGLTRPIEGRAAQLIDEVSRRGLPVCAVDLPSGLLADSGRQPGPVLRARCTATFGRLKPAFFTPGGTLAGEVRVVDIGVAREGHSIARRTDAAELAARWPRRGTHAYKQSSGHLAVVAGSVAMAGAAVLTTAGAIAAGAGLVTLFVPADALSRLSGLSPTVMVRPMALPDAMEASAGFDALAIGPGIGGGAPLSKAAREQLASVVAREQPMVVDADALLPGVDYGPCCVLTPHPGEAGRLLGRGSRDIQEDRFAAVQELPATTLLKGRHTLIRGPERIAVNPTGAPTLATAGAGDVLTGVVGALLARGMSPFDAAQAAAFVHGRAGELLQAERAEGWSAVDIAQRVPVAIQELLDVPA